MKIREVIDRILAYHPALGADYNGCDDYKCGNPDEECTGVVSALVPTIDVIRKTGELGCNLLFVHEPTFYTSEDGAGWFEDFENEIYEEKQKLLKQYGIVIWRDHDHMHAHQPDSIFTGVEKYLGWEDMKLEMDGQSPFIYCYRLPEKMTVAALNQYLIEKIGIDGTRYIGNPQSEVQTVAIVGHLFPNCFGLDHVGEDGHLHEYTTDIIKLMEQGVDAIIPGEVVDWTVLSYVRDAAMLGRNKAVFNIGHYAMEELGMKYVEDWLPALLDGKVSVTYAPSGSMYRFAEAVED